MFPVRPNAGSHLHSALPFYPCLSRALTLVLSGQFRYPAIPQPQEPRIALDHFRH